jgi:nucleoside-diphosphate-sugar epimerase
VYGPYSFFVTPIVQDAREGRISLVDGGRGICNAVYVDDVCESVVAAIRRDDAVGACVQVNGDSRITWRCFITTFADMVEGDKTVHDHSLDDIAAHWQAQRPRAKDSITAAIRLLASPAFHAQLGTIPPVGRLIRGTKQLVSRRITREQKAMLKSRVQGRKARTGQAAAEPRPVRVPSEGRVVREAYRSWVANDLAKERLGWKPAYSFVLGAQRTREWLRFARLVCSLKFFDHAVLDVEQAQLLVQVVSSLPAA